MVEFAYNRVKHSSTNLSPFEIVYGFKPQTPLDLAPIPLPRHDQINQDGVAKADMVKKLYQKAKENMEKRNARTKKHSDQHRRELNLEPGDHVWIHMREDRFPNMKRNKLSPRGIGPYQVIRKINDNAYELDLRGEFNISPTFNVADLVRYEDETVLRSEPSQGGEDAAAIKTATATNAATATIPTMRSRPVTRSGKRTLQDNLNKAVKVLLRQLEANGPTRTDPSGPAHPNDPAGPDQEEQEQGQEDQNQEVQDLGEEGHDQTGPSHQEQGVNSTRPIVPRHADFQPDRIFPRHADPQPGWTFPRPAYSEYRALTILSITRLKTNAIRSTVRST